MRLRGMTGTPDGSIPPIRNPFVTGDGRFEVRDTLFNVSETVKTVNEQVRSAVPAVERRAANWRAYIDRLVKR